MIPNKANIDSKFNFELWISSRGASTDETKPCALPTQAALEAAATEPVTTTATGTTVAGNWYRGGVTREDSLKLGGTPYQDLLQGGSPKQTGMDHKLECEIMETDITRMSNLEAMLDYTCDLILKQKNSARVIYIKGMGFTLGYENPFSKKKASHAKLTAQKASDKINRVALVVSGFPTTQSDIYDGNLSAS
jgi:hypothetical protein